MRELTVYCCPDCGRYGFYQISRNAVCPICSRPMTALPVSYQIFMELDLEERSQLIAKQKEQPAFKAAPGESASGESSPCNGSATNTDIQKQTEAKPDAQAPGTQDPDAQAPGKQTPRIEKTDRRTPDMQKPRKNTQKTKSTPKAARSSHARPDGCSRETCPGTCDKTCSPEAFLAEREQLRQENQKLLRQKRELEHTVSWMHDMIWDLTRRLHS